MTEQTEGGAPAPEADAVSRSSDLAEADPKNLRSVVRWVAVEVFVYVIVALVLIYLSLRRGRLSDAILVMLTLLITTPMILGYRQQAIARLRRGLPEAAGTADGDDGADAPPPAPS